MNEMARILVVNDEEDLSRYLRERLVITGGYLVDVETNAHAGLERFRQNGFDLVITKLGIPGMEIIDLVKSFKQIDPDCILIGLAEDIDNEKIKELMRLGVYEILAKPINIEKTLFLVKKGIELRALILGHRKTSQSFKEQNVSLQKQNVLLAKRIEESTKNLTRLYEDLRSTYMRTIKVLAHAIDARDHYTHSHSENVAKIAVVIAEEMHLSAEQVEMVREACELHDLGKIGVEDSILTKPSELDQKEWESIKRHPLIGAQILEPLTFLDGVIDLVRQHHEHYDGTGYPYGLKGEEILLGARIINLADAYEAMRSERSYRREPFTKERAVTEVKDNIGKQFDPKVVEAFLKVIDQL